MRKVMTVSLILIFLPVCPSFGAIGQAEGFLLGAENGAALAGGPGAAQNTNVAVVGHNQQSSDPYHCVTAIQTEGGVLVQGAYAAGMGGVFGVGQVGTVIGGQLQAPDGQGVGIQDQFLNGTFAQDVAKIGGIGAALGVQGFVGVQVQLIVSPHGANANVQYLGLGLVDHVGGGP
jgi:hypothetical protein